MAENPAPTAKWQFWIDRGGTFTDVFVIETPGGGGFGTPETAKTAKTAIKAAES